MKKKKYNPGTAFLICYLMMLAVGVFWGAIGGLVSLAIFGAFYPVMEIVITAFALAGAAIGIASEVANAN